MSESSTGKRIVFPSGKQRMFIENIENHLSVSEMASLCACSMRTIRDWRREKCSMTLDAAHILSKKSGIALPKNVRIVPMYAHTSEAGRKGGAAIIEKYGRIPVDSVYRNEKWLKWWEKEGRYKKQDILLAKPIRKPRKSTELAEFVGIMMGDGGISSYQVTISLNSKTDTEYIQYVSDLIARLFDVTPSVYYPSNAQVANIVVSRKDLVTYLHAAGLPIGDKIRQNLDMPEWIKKNRSFSILCVRGLVDTDGCVFTHSYVVKGKRYHYKKLDFTSASESLRTSVAAFLFSLGMRPRFSSQRGVRLESKADVARYFSLIGTHNPKHLKRYESEVG